MKKMIAILLALMLMVTIFILPVLAAEQRAHTCPKCGQTAYSAWPETVWEEEPVASCSNYPGSHSHTFKLIYTKIFCDYCNQNSYVDKTTTILCPYA